MYEDHLRDELDKVYKQKMYNILLTKIQQNTEGKMGKKSVLTFRDSDANTIEWMLIILYFFTLAIYFILFLGSFYLTKFAA